MKYLFKTTVSDISPFTDGNQKMEKQSGTTGQVNISIGAMLTEAWGWIVEMGLPNSDAWEDSGSQTVELVLSTTNSNIRARCKVVRISPVGTGLDEGAFTGFQDCSVNRTFTPTAPAFDNAKEDCANRYAIEWEFENTNAHGGAQAIDVDCGAADDSSVTTDITEDSGSCRAVFGEIMQGQI